MNSSLHEIQSDIQRLATQQHQIQDLTSQHQLQSLVNQQQHQLQVVCALPNRTYRIEIKLYQRDLPIIIIIIIIIIK